MKLLVLTDEQAALLLDTLESTNDEGPQDEAWKSDKLVNLIEVVKHQINKT